MSNKSRALILLLGGILPVIAFAVVEEWYGVIWGTIAGMLFGVGEIIYEKINFKSVSGTAWFSNLLIMVLGGISLISSEGVWFKLQPAISMFCFAGILLGSSLIDKPFLVGMALKQNPNLPPQALAMIRTLNLRLSFLLLFLTLLLAWAAMKWSTEAWAFLKSVGIFIILFLYMGGEVLYKKLR